MRWLAGSRAGWRLGWPAETSRSRTLWLVTVAAVTYTFAIRAWDVSEHFWLAGDQIRDWSVALRDAGELPLVGPSSLAGGHLIGPTFYWVLWFTRVVTAPLFGNLPHAGAFGLIALHSLADGLLFRGIETKTRSIPLALATVLFMASAPYDMAFARATWNPTWGVIFVKSAIALVFLVQRGTTHWHLGLVVAAAWLAVHGHMGAVFAVLGVLMWALIRGLQAPTPVGKAQMCLAWATPILILQLPWLAAQIFQPAIDTSPSVVLQSIGSVVRGEGNLRLAVSYRSLSAATDFILLNPPLAGTAAVLLPVCLAFVAYRSRRDVASLCVTVLPILGAWVGFALWQHELLEYWYLGLIPSVALTLALAVAGIPRTRFTATLEILLLAAVIVIQPARLARAATMLRFDGYGVLVQASRRLASQEHALREIRVPPGFLPPRSDARFLFQVLGGRISNDATLAARIDRSGQVTYESLGASSTPPE